MDEDWKNFEIPNSEKYETLKALPYTAGNNPLQTLYLSIPRQKDRELSCVVWFHGGGMSTDGRECPPSMYDGSQAVIEPRYRICPADPAPAQLEDAAAALGWVYENAEKHGIDRRQIFVGGMSAGAYLAALVTMNKDFGRRYGYDRLKPAGLLLVSGQMTTHFQVKADLRYPGGQYLPVIDNLAPLAHLSADGPPTIMITGQSGLDIPGRPEENALMAASLRAMGHPMVEHHALAGHDHGGAFSSCNHLLAQFILAVLKGK